MTKLTLKNFRNYSSNNAVLNLIETRLNRGIEIFAMESHETARHQQYCCSLDGGFTAIKTNPRQFN